MNKKGQIEMGHILYVFIAVIVGLILFQAIAQQVGTTRDTVSVVNQNNVAAANGANFYFTDYRAISSLVAYNLTNGTAIASGGHIVLIGSGNYTVNNNIVYNGALATSITVDNALFASETWNMSYTGQPLTYIADSGARAMAYLIVIFFALAIAGVALYPIYSSKMLEMMGK